MMMYNWEKGLSMSFFNNMDRDALAALKARGIRQLELSFSHDDYYGRFDLPHRAKEWKALLDEFGLSVWSLHLPFSAVWDISAPTFRETVDSDIELMRAAALMGAKVAVVHPSFEPIENGDRPLRFERARISICRLSGAAQAFGMTLGVENLPRTCLGNTSEEMCRLLTDTGAHFLFDTNHSLSEDNVHFLRTMLNAGFCPVSLHISDYDFVDERHDLPGTGVNRWHELLELLRSGRYAGPALYEIRHVVNEHRILSFEQVAENMELLLAGKID